MHFIEICMSESGPVDPAKLATPVKKEKKQMESPEKPTDAKPAGHEQVCAKIFVLMTWVWTLQRVFDRVLSAQ